MSSILYDYEGFQCIDLSVTVFPTSHRRIKRWSRGVRRARQHMSVKRLWTDLKDIFGTSSRQNTMTSSPPDLSIHCFTTFGSDATEATPEVGGFESARLSSLRSLKSGKELSRKSYGYHASVSTGRLSESAPGVAMNYTQDAESAVWSGSMVSDESHRCHSHYPVRPWNDARSGKSIEVPAL